MQTDLVHDCVGAVLYEECCSFCDILRQHADGRIQVGANLCHHLGVIIANSSVQKSKGDLMTYILDEDYQKEEIVACVEKNMD